MDFSAVKNIVIPEGNVKSISAGGKTIWKKSRLPSGYTELSFIKSTGTQYINTALDYETAKVYVLDIAFNASSASCIIGFNANAGMYFGKNGEGKAYMGSTSIINIDATERHTYEFDITTRTSRLKVGDLATSRTRSADPSVPFRTFVSGYGASGLVMYNIKAYLDDELVIDLIPCINPDNEIGMYDLISQEFFGNAGTGNFVAGEPV